MAEEDIVTWARAGGRAGSFKGAVYSGGELVWSCTCRHASKEGAVACARAGNPCRWRSASPSNVAGGGSDDREE